MIECGLFQDFVLGLQRIPPRHYSYVKQSNESHLTQSPPPSVLIFLEEGALMEKGESRCSVTYSFLKKKKVNLAAIEYTMCIYNSYFIYCSVNIFKLNVLH